MCSGGRSVWVSWEADAKTRLERKRSIGVNVCKKKKKAGEGKATGEGRQTFQIMMQIWHLRKEKRKDCIGRSPNHRAILKKFKPNHWGGSQPKLPWSHTSSRHNTPAILSHWPGAAWWQHGLAVMDAEVCHQQVSVSSVSWSRLSWRLLTTIGGMHKDILCDIFLYQQKM